ncbi:hypothetical protein E2320_022555, partial [Naja naja]
MRGLQSAKGCWEALRSVYMRETMCSKVLLTKRLYKAQLKPGESMSTHLQNMRTFLELEERGMTFTESHKMYMVLSSLDSSWDVLVTSLESMQEQDLTMAYLTGRLLEEEQKQLERQPGKGGESVQHRPASKKGQDGGRAAERMNFVKRCYIDVALRGGTEEQQDKGTGLLSTCGAVLQSFSLAASMTEHTRNTWLLDSGVSQHIANNPQAFSGLKPAKQTWVSLVNGQRAAVKAEGNVYVPEIDIEEDRPVIKSEDTEEIDIEEERHVTKTQEHIIPRRSERSNK